MSYLVSLIRRYPLITFFVLAYALSWWPLVVKIGGPVAEGIFPFGPMLAAIVLTALTLGWIGTKALLARQVRWRVGVRWYAVALLLPAVLAVAAVSLNVMLGAPAPTEAVLAGVVALPMVFVFRLVFSGPLGEELGWRGYALPRLQVGRSALSASLILGVIWATWHLPFYLSGAVTLVEFASTWVSTFAATIVITWLFNNTNGSVLLTMLLHASNGTMLGGFFFKMFSAADALTLGWLVAGVWCVAAIVVVIVAGPEHLSRKHRKQEEPAQPEVATAAPRVV